MAEWNVESNDTNKKEVVRQNLLLNFPERAVVRYYDNGDTAGFRGWVEMEDFGVVCYLPTDLSESTFTW